MGRRTALTATLVGLALLLVAPALTAVSAPEREGRGPPVQVLAGSGSRVLSLRLGASRPLVVTATHTGSSNFIVHLYPRGQSQILLFNVIGAFSGQTAVADAKAGSYRVQVEADGRWQLRFKQPVPTSRAKVLPGTVAGKGYRVIQVQTKRSLQPVATAVYRGADNFIVYLIGYGHLQGTTLVFNEIGNFHGQTIVDSMPAGDYLLQVEGTGSWSLRFQP